MDHEIVNKNAFAPTAGIPGLLAPTGRRQGF
jgi:hypothetical protein